MLRHLKKLVTSTVVISTGTAIVIVLSVYFFVIFSDYHTSSDDLKQIYFADNISPAHQKVIDIFNKKYSGQIKVESIDIPFSKFSTNERKELFARYLRSKSEQIDVFSVDQIWLSRFAKWCEPLDGYFSAQEKESILPAALRSCYFHDTLATVPLFIDIGLLYYRQDVIAQLPNGKSIEKALSRSMTWDEFVALGRHFHDPEKPFYIFPAANYEGLMCSFVEMLAGQEKPLFRNDSLFICSPEAKKALTLLVDLVHTYHLAPPQVTQFKEMSSYDYFVRHQGIFLRGWPNFLRDYQSARGSLPVTGRIVKAPLPHFSGHPPVSILGGWNLMISKYSTQKKEALLFVKFLLSEEAQKVMYEEGGYLSVNNLLYDDQQYTQEHPDLAFYQQLMKTGVQRPVAEDYTKMSDIISEYLRQAINKNVTPEQALARASEKIRAEEW